jgi:putative oxidoreductase
MDKVNAYLPTIGRVLLGILFLVAGLGKLAGGVEGFAGYMASGGLPAFLAWPVVLFEIIAGAFIIAGFQTRYTALALAAFCLASGIMYHGAADMSGLLKNIALTGAFLRLYASGAGSFAVDKA